MQLAGIWGSSETPGPDRSTSVLRASIPRATKGHPTARSNQWSGSGGTIGEAGPKPVADLAVPLPNGPGCLTER